VNVQYNDRTYNLWLHPVDGINTRSQSSVKGLVKDFEWLLSGATPYAKTQPNSPSAYYGGTVGLGNNSQFEMTYGSGYVEEHKYPAGSKIVLEFTPTGPLMDGSEGKVLKYDIKPEDLATKAVRDVPLSDYTVKASLVEKDGKTSALLVASVIPGGPFGEKIVPAEEGRVEFVPSRMGDYGIEPMTLFVLPD
jgi:hypothetical protein